MPKTYTYEEVEKHNKENDCWMVIYGKVYDCTNFMEDHPGGPEILMSVAGQEATEEFEDVFHSEKAQKQLDDFYVGDIKDYDGPTKGSSAVSTSSVNKNNGGTLYLVPLFIILIGIFYQFVLNN